MVIYVTVSEKNGQTISNRVMVNVLPGGTVTQTSKMVRKSVADERRVRPSQMGFVAYGTVSGQDILAKSA
jgi:hypothetical protein